MLAHGPGMAETVSWQPEWRKVQPFEYASTAVLSASAIGVAFLVDPRDSGHYGGVSFDGSVRKLLRAETRSGRDTARSIGDFGYQTMGLFPFIDALLSWAVHRNGEVAWQMIAMDLEAMAVAGFVGIMTDHFIGRARPSTAPCHENPDYEKFCNKQDEFSSFLSGHSVIAAAGAGVTCAHHLSLPLYGGGAADIAACAVTSALALTTGLARIVNDRHWATDVTAAWIAGAAIGYIWPRYFHYRRGDDDKDAVSFSVYPSIGPGQYSGTLAGAF